MHTPAYMRLIGTAQPQPPDIIGTEPGQPPRVGPTRVLGTDEGPRAHDGIQAELLLRHFEPAPYLRKVEAGGVVQARRHRPLVSVPRNIGLDRIETRSLYLAETVAPQLLGAPEIVERRTVDEHVPAVDRHARPVVTHPLGVGKLLDGLFGVIARSAQAHKAAQQRKRPSEKNNHISICYLLDPTFHKLPISRPQRHASILRPRVMPHSL